MKIDLMKALTNSLKGVYSMYVRNYSGSRAALIVTDPPPQEWRWTRTAVSRSELVARARGLGMFPIFAPRSGRYADIRASIVGFEQQRRRELERRADELRRCLDPAHLDEHGPSADEIGQIRDELESIGEQLAELATEDAVKAPQPQAEAGEEKENARLWSNYRTGPRGNQ